MSAFIDYKEKDGIPVEYSIHCLTSRQIQFLYSGLISAFVLVNSKNREREEAIYQLRRELNSLISIFDVLKTHFII